MAVGISNYPTSLDAASDLVEATNNASTTINMVGGLSNSATTITVVSTAAFPSTGIVRIDDEVISYSAKTSTTFTVQTRGFESTTAASHIDGATVSLDITAASNNAKNTAIIALETKVGTGSSTPTANTVLRGTGTGTSAFGQVGLTTDVTGTLPAANGGTGITSLGANVATFLGTPSSANLASAVTDETGSGALVFANSPTLTTPSLGTPSALTLTNATGLPVSGITASTSAALGVGSIELGHATDTTLARGAAGRLTVEGVNVPTVSSTDTLTNKTLTLPTIGSTGFTLTGSGGSGATTILTSATGSGTVTIPAVATTATLATVMPSVSLSPTSSNPTVTLNQRHFINLSGLTADRNFVLPAGAVGDIVVVSITAGNSTYAMLLIGASGITINGGSAATEWSRLFITGESVTFVANSTTNWQVLEDGRIPVKARMHYVGTTGSISIGTLTQKIPFTTIKFDNANVCDLTNYDIKFRRKNVYILSGGFKWGGASGAGLPANVTRLVSWIGTSTLAQAAMEQSGISNAEPLNLMVALFQYEVGDTRGVYCVHTYAGTLYSGASNETIHLDVVEVF